MTEKLVNIRGQQFWVKAYPLDSAWSAAYYRAMQGDPKVDFVVARFNSGDPSVSLDQQLLCLGVTRPTPAEAEELAEAYIDSVLMGKHKPMIWLYW